MRVHVKYVKMPQVMPPGNRRSGDCIPGDFLKPTKVNLSGTIGLTIKKTDTVAAVKQKIQCKEGIPVDVQILSFGGQQLSDTELVSAYGVQDGSFINLVVRVSGAGDTLGQPKHGVDGKELMGSMNYLNTLFRGAGHRKL